MAYNSQYTGAQVEELLGKIGSYVGMPIVELAAQSSQTITLSPNTMYQSSAGLTSVVFEFGGSDSSKVEEYVLVVTDVTNVADVSFPETIVWANGVAPTFSNPTVISIIGDFGVCAEFTA